MGSEKLPPLVPTPVCGVKKFVATEQIAEAQMRLQMQIVAQLEAQLGRERGKLDDMMARMANARVIEGDIVVKAPKCHPRVSPLAIEGYEEVDLIGENFVFSL